MSSHFSTIGFTVTSEDEFGNLVVRAANSGKSIESPKGTYVYWSDVSGAELWVQLDANNQIIGVTPFFAGSAQMRVKLVKRVNRPKDSALDGAFYAWADPMGAVIQEPDDHDGIYPFVFDLPDFLLYNKPNLPSVAQVQLAAFAHALKAYQNEEDYNASQQSGLKYAPESFIPSGLFSPKLGNIDPPNAFAIFTGRVIDSATRINSITQEPFEWAHVRTLGGEVDVVADSHAIEGQITPGGLVHGSFWLVGRLAEYSRREQ